MIGRILLALGLFAVAIAPVTAMADQQQDQDACMQDAQTICGNSSPIASGLRIV
jgi:hypothetical protein